jgi:hypothetical protein
MKHPFLNTVTTALLILSASLYASSTAAQTAYAVDNAGNLVKFSATAPGSLMTVQPITGLIGGDTVLAIDFRPATGQLYALGSGSRLYTINLTTGAATKVGTSGAFTLSGTVFDIDFNPTVDRIRVVSDADQNLRLHPDTGAIAAVDTSLAYAVGGLNAGANPNITAVAYSSNIVGASTTTLFGIDSTLDIMVSQNPPNNGTLNTLGGLGLIATTVLGFDIVTAGSTDTAYALMEFGGVTRLYTVNLTTGAATAVGTIGSGAALRGLAVTSSVDYSGAWYNLTESGWGLSVLRGDAGTYGIIMYNYNQTRAPTWYFMSGGTLIGSNYTAPVLLYSGPWFGESFGAVPVTSTVVGSATITFTSNTTASINYTISGVSVTKIINRLSF